MIQKDAAGRNHIPSGRFYFLSLFLLTICAATTGCVPQTIRGRHDLAESVAAASGMTPAVLSGGDFAIHAYVKGESAGALTVYIEGDGFAFANRTTVSDDPTPKNPVGLRLAARDPDTAVAWLARPCQYGQPGESPACQPYFWTLGRFSPPVVAAVNQALDLLKERYKARSLRLVGYSGGGAMAVLAAAGRDDVAFIATVAGNLDTKLWCGLHNLTELAGSLNPADSAIKVAAIPQVHFVGGRDTNMPETVARSFAARAGSPATLRIVTVPDLSHGCCWDTVWPDLVRRYFPDKAGEKNQNQ